MVIALRVSHVTNGFGRVDRFMANDPRYATYDIWEMHRTTNESPFAGGSLIERSGLTYTVVFTP